MFVGRCCACSPKGDINGFWVRPGKVLLTNLSDVGTESVEWVRYQGSAYNECWYKIDDDFTTWDLNEKRLCYGFRLDTYVPTTEQESHKYTTLSAPTTGGSVVALQFPFAVGDGMLNVSGRDVGSPFGNKLIALAAEKTIVANKKVNIESNLISHLLIPQLINTGIVLGHRLAYYRILHDGEAVTDILPAFDSEITSKKLKPIGVSGGTGSNTSVAKHTLIDELNSPSDTTFVYTSNNSTSRIDVGFEKTYVSRSLDGNSIVLRLCESRSGVLTTNTDTPSGVSVTVQIVGVNNNAVTIDTIVVPVVPTTYTINISESQMSSAQNFTNFLHNLNVRVIPTAVVGAGAAIIQLYRNQPTQWEFRQDDQVTSIYTPNSVWLDGIGGFASPNSWNIPENLRQYKFTKNVRVSVDLWYELVKRQDTATPTMAFLGMYFNDPVVNDIESAITGFGFGVKYISKFDKTKRTWKVTYSGGTWRPLCAINDTVKFSNYPITVNDSYGDIDDTFAYTTSGEHSVGLYWNAEVPTLITHPRKYYHPSGDTVEVTKSLLSSPYTWTKDFSPSGYWNPAKPTTFYRHDGIVATTGATIPTPFPPSATETEHPTSAIVEQVPAKRVYVRIFRDNANWTSPSALLNVNEITVECWGAGGGGGGTGFSGGGGGGAYSRSVVSISPDTVYLIRRGLEGAVGTAAPTNGGNGGSSWFELAGTKLVEALGGSGSVRGVSGSPSVGGTGGAASGGIGDIKFSGGNGLSASVSANYYGGGSGGWEADGNTPTAATKLPVAVKHGSGGDSEGNLTDYHWLWGMGGTGTSSGNRGMLRISYEYENIDIIERRFNTTTKWIAPEGVTTVNVQCWGAGGGSGGTDGYSGSASGGGGGGAYVWKIVTVVPLAEYDVNVGIGGDSGSTTVNGGDGGDSWFINSSTVKAAGGKGGQSAVLDDDEAGGAGGLASDSVGDEKWSGGNGADGLSSNYGGGGGSSASNGSDGTSSTNGNGGIPPARGGYGGDQTKNGQFPGGGAGGVQGTGGDPFPPNPGKQGADGYVILQYAG